MTARTIAVALFHMLFPRSAVIVNQPDKMAQTAGQKNTIENCKSQDQFGTLFATNSMNTEPNNAVSVEHTTATVTNNLVQFIV